MPDLRALRVAQTTSQLLQAKHLKRQPAWLPTVSRLPPSTEIARQPPAAELVRKRPARQGTHKVRRLFELQPIRYSEDALRQRFYREHPWELARPTLLLENDALDYTRSDWSRMQQPGRRTSGEFVVQRQLYLMREGHAKEAAYALALKEFYAIRQRESVEARIAMEEALAYGTRFNPSQMEVALNLESKVLTKWREKALYAKSLDQVGQPGSTADAGRVERRNKKKKSADEAEDKGSAGEEEETDVLDDLLN